jgi:NADH-ubiquinone oxidoreductase-F iron-sulfur binding region
MAEAYQVHRRGWRILSARGATAVAAGAARFLAVESCGQCTPFKRDGLTLAETLERLCGVDGHESDLDTITSALRTVADWTHHPEWSGSYPADLLTDHRQPHDLDRGTAGSAAQPATTRAVEMRVLSSPPHVRVVKARQSGG